MVGNVNYGIFNTFGHFNAVFDDEVAVKGKMEQLVETRVAAVSAKWDCIINVHDLPVEGANGTRGGHSLQQTAG